MTYRVAFLLAASLCSTSPYLSAQVESIGLAEQEYALQLGPIEGLTTQWHPAPSQTKVPVGSTVRLRLATGLKCDLTQDGRVDNDDLIEFLAGLQAQGRGKLGRADLNQDGIVGPSDWRILSQSLFAEGQYGLEEIRWEGATCTASGADFSEAKIFLDRERSYVVRAIRNRDGKTLARVRLDGVWISSEQIQFRIDSVRPLEEFQEAKGNFIVGSPALLHSLGSGKYLTSVDRKIGLTVRSEPAGFENFAEWRLDGHVLPTSGHDITLAADSVGKHKIQAGPVDRRGTSPESNPAIVEIETYAVFLDLSIPALSELSPCSDFVSRAYTEPPGYEDEIVWFALIEGENGKRRIEGASGEFLAHRHSSPSATCHRLLNLRAGNAVWDRSMLVAATCVVRCDTTFGRLETSAICCEDKNVGETCRPSGTPFSGGSLRARNLCDVYPNQVCETVAICTGVGDVVCGCSRP